MMNNNRNGDFATRRLLMTTALSAAAFMMPPAVGQGLAQERSVGLEEIVVTARKRVESLQNIPVAVSALSAEQIERRDLTSLEKIAATTPQFTVGRTSSGSGAQMSMRGIGSNSTSIGIEQSVAVVVDGAYSGQGRVIYQGFLDLERAEILRGPQALFYGKNATAGVVSLQTKDPGEDVEIIGRLGYEFGSERLTGEAILSTPITDKLGIRIALRGLHMWGGYYDNTSPTIPYPTTDIVTGATSNFTAPVSDSEMPQEEEFIGRITLKWEPTDRLSARLKGAYNSNEVNNNSWNYVSFACATGFSTLAPDVPCEDDVFEVHQNDMPPEVAAETNFARDGSLYNDFEIWYITGQIDYEFDDMSLTSVFNYSETENSWNCNCAYQTGPIWATEFSTWREYSNETRLITDFDGPVNLLMGIYFQDTHRDFAQNVIFAGSENSAAPPGQRFVSYLKDSETDGQTISAFGQVTWDILDNVELAGGVRWLRETKDSFFVQPYVNPGLTALFVEGEFVRADQTFKNWSPEVTVTWFPTDDLTLYAGYRTAYKSGGLSNSGIYSALSTTPDEDFIFEPEEAQGFEIGLKSTLLDSQLRLNVTAYRYKFTNLQVDFFNAPTFAFLTVNAGSSLARGIETEFEYAPRAVPGLSLLGSLNYNKARYQEFIGPCYSGQSVQAGCPSPTGPGGFPQQDLSGTPPAVAPEWTATLGGYYETALTKNYDVGFSTHLRYSDDYLASNLGSELSRVDSYVTVDASVRFMSTDRTWEFAVIGKNLTDQQYFLGMQDAPATGSGTGTPDGIAADQSGYGTIPRTVEVQFTYRF